MQSKYINIISAIALVFSIQQVSAEDVLNADYQVIDEPYINKTPVNITELGQDWLLDKKIYINLPTTNETRTPVEVMIGELDIAGLKIVSSVDLSNVYYSGKSIEAGETALSVVNKIADNTSLGYQVHFRAEGAGFVELTNMEQKKPAPMSTELFNNIPVVVRGGRCEFVDSDDRYTFYQNKHYFKLREGTVADNFQTLIDKAFTNYRIVNKVGHHMVFNSVCLSANTKDELVQRIIEPYSTPHKMYFGTFINDVAAIFYEGDQTFAKYFRGRK